MTAQLIDRRALKAETRETLAEAQVSPKAFTALYLALVLAMNLVDSFTGIGMLATFVSILITLLALVLEAGFVLYCMAVRQGERAEFLALFDGFSFAGKVIGLSIVKYFFIFLWSLLFTIPGIIAAYRYRFALYNLCENPEISIMEALDMSKRQTLGYKGQLFMLDLSYLGWALLAGVPHLLLCILSAAVPSNGGALWCRHAGRRFVGCCDWSFARLGLDAGHGALADGGCSLLPPQLPMCGAWLF